MPRYHLGTSSRTNEFFGLTDLLTRAQCYAAIYHRCLVLGVAQGDIEKAIRGLVWHNSYEIYGWRQPRSIDESIHIALHSHGSPFNQYRAVLHSMNQETGAEISKQSSARLKQFLQIQKQTSVSFVNDAIIILMVEAILECQKADLLNLTDVLEFSVIMSLKGDAGMLNALLKQVPRISEFADGGTRALQHAIEHRAPQLIQQFIEHDDWKHSPEVLGSIIAVLQKKYRWRGDDLNNDAETLLLTMLHQYSSGLSADFIVTTELMSNIIEFVLTSEGPLNIDQRRALFDIVYQKAHPKILGSFPSIDTRAKLDEFLGHYHGDELRSPGGRSILHEIILNGNLEYIFAILRKKPELLQSKDRNGHTPLDFLFLTKYRVSERTYAIEKTEIEKHYETYFSILINDPSNIAKNIHEMTAEKLKQYFMFLMLNKGIEEATRLAPFAFENACLEMKPIVNALFTSCVFEYLLEKKPVDLALIHRKYVEEHSSHLGIALDYMDKAFLPVLLDLMIDGAPCLSPEDKKRIINVNALIEKNDLTQLIKIAKYVPDDAKAIVQCLANKKEELFPSLNPNDHLLTEFVSLIKIPAYRNAMFLNFSREIKQYFDRRGYEISSELCEPEWLPEFSTATSEAPVELKGLMMLIPKVTCSFDSREAIYQMTHRLDFLKRWDSINTSLGRLSGKRIQLELHQIEIPFDLDVFQCTALQNVIYSAIDTLPIATEKHRLKAQFVITPEVLAQKRAEFEAMMPKVPRIESQPSRAEGGVAESKEDEFDFLGCNSMR